jgi:hypothetical protein
LLSLNIKQEAVDPDDTETLADLIVAAVRDASENAKEAAARAMGPLAGGIPGFGSEGPGLPGLGGASSAPVGFGLPGATTVPGETTTESPDSDEDTSTAGGAGFVNPGSGTGAPGQNQG